MSVCMYICIGIVTFLFFCLLLLELGDLLLDTVEALEFGVVVVVCQRQLTYVYRELETSYIVA